MDISNYELTSEREKLKQSNIEKFIDKSISELVYDKDGLRKAYNYYNGTYDKDQFRHLEENFGIGTPTSIEFIPLVRRHIDSLIGRHLQNKLKPKITCKDRKTLSNIEREKQIAIANKEYSLIKDNFSKLVNSIFVEGKEILKNEFEAELQRELDSFEQDFISEYETAAQYVLKHLSQSKNVDLHHKRWLLFKDLLITGQCYYNVKIRREGQDPEIEVLNPIDVFYDKNMNSLYIKNSSRVVVRKFMNKQQIITEYGKSMDQEDLEKLNSALDYMGTHNVYYIRGNSSGIVSGIGATIAGAIPENERDGRLYRDGLIPVYEVQWLTNNKTNDSDKFKTDRFEGVRIGGDIYINVGKSENVVRSRDNELDCTLSVNGIAYSDRNGSPYSVVLATAALQDKYNVLHFYRDNLIANSGTKGDYVNIAYLPAFLGTSPEERLLKYQAYKKTGLALIDTTQEGDAPQLINTIFNGYDDTVNGNSIEAIQLAISQVEEICSSITGVSRSELGNIEEREAVGNVELSTRKSAVISKQYYDMMDLITTELLTDALNMAKIAYKDGIKGTVVLGEKLHKIFTAMPEHFALSDHDIHIADSGDIIRDMQKIESFTIELIKSQAVDLDIVVETATCESLTEMKENVTKALKKKKKENDIMQQMQQQIEQMDKQIKEAQSELQKVHTENENLKKQASEIEKYKIDKDYDIKNRDLALRSKSEAEKAEQIKKRTELEALQLLDNQKQNDEVKNV